VYNGGRSSDLALTILMCLIPWPMQREAVTTALLEVLYAHPFGCWAQKRPKIEATFTTVT
jgi:hypothetical protein